jgi:hypothetical protein
VARRVGSPVATGLQILPPIIVPSLPSNAAAYSVVTSSGWLIEVVEIERPYRTTQSTDHRGQEWMRIRLRFTNTTDSAMQLGTVVLAGVKIQSASGVIRDVGFEQRNFPDSLDNSRTLAPGFSLEGNIYFSVPPGERQVKIMSTGYWGQADVPLP